MDTTSPHSYKRNSSSQPSFLGFHVSFRECIYSFSHNHGSGKWVPPRLVSFQLGQFIFSMIMEGRVAWFLLFTRHQDDAEGDLLANPFICQMTGWNHFHESWQVTSVGPFRRLEKPGKHVQRFFFSGRKKWRTWSMTNNIYIHEKSIYIYTVYIQNGGRFWDSWELQLVLTKIICLWLWLCCRFLALLRVKHIIYFLPF